MNTTHVVLMTSEVANLLNVSGQTVRTWESSGLLPAAKTARGVRLFDRRDVEALKRARDGRRGEEQHG